MRIAEFFANASPLLPINEDDAFVFEGKYVEVSISSSNDDKFRLRRLARVLMFCAATLKFSINSNIKVFIINNAI